MQISARILDNVSDVNSYTAVRRLELTEGDLPKIYVMLVDASKDRAEDGFFPGGRRYMPAAGSMLSITLDHIDTARKLTRVATQPFPLDPSIWMIELMPTDKVLGTVNMILSLTESGKTSKGLIQNAIGVRGLSGMTRY